jgi:hypothetical protein
MKGPDLSACCTSSQLSTGLFRDTIVSMAETVVSRKRRGPAPTGKGLPVQVRLQPAQLDALDA